MRKLGIQQIEDIALGASLLGAGGGGDPYIGKLMAIGAVRECGEVTLISPEEVPDDALIMPIAMMGAPTVLCEKGIGGTEYKRIFEMVERYFGRKVYATMPMEAGGVQFHAAHRSGGTPRTAHGRLRRNGARLPGTADGHLHHRRRVRHAHGPDG